MAQLFNYPVPIGMTGRTLRRRCLSISNPGSEPTADFLCQLATPKVLDEIEFFERERTDRQLVELAILLYDVGVSLRKVKRVLGWIGVKGSHIAIWNWV